MMEYKRSTIKLSELLKTASNEDRIRIIKGSHGNGDAPDVPGNKILYCGFIGCMQYADYTEYARQQLAGDPEVKGTKINTEIRHRNYKDLGLLPPYEPEITRRYEFSDLTLMCYYDIYID